ncbi:MAG: hypothetical protein M3N47_14050 [Chloroflexota bacterium]|nr:hypothetical protein [Chloroflexota bacterium]
MGLTTELASSVGIPVRRAGSLELITWFDAAAFLDECSKAGVRVLGVEGFRLPGGKTLPDMSAIADLSDVADPAESVAEARKLVAEIGAPDLLLEFTLSREAA